MLPGEIVSELFPSHGNVRHFLETVVLQPLDQESQRAAGEAAALNALGELYDVDPEELVVGYRSVHGAVHAAGGIRRLSDPHPDIPQDAGAAAFFDVDNTLVQGASIFLFGLGLARRGFFDPGEMAGMLWKQIKFRISGSEDAVDVAKAREQALAFIRGHRVDETSRMAEEIFDEIIGDRVYAGTRQLADLHLQAGQEVWLVTAAPVQLAQVIAPRLGLTGALGTVAEVEDGVFTGRLVGDILHGPGKKHAVAALAASSGLDLSRCAAYSDSVNDVPMLSMVGSAVAVNPDRRLRREATDRGWSVYEYRRVRRNVIATIRWGLFGVIGLSSGVVGYRAWSWWSKRRAHAGTASGTSAGRRPTPGDQ
ncbi:HAD family phosphatase [uncultured Corynebacterium sp.]|uniref:HAD family hydrolase n=1 Tax=uncultured Corynebacterium sp. TaxID=159447 RepID=UPI0025D098B5|nr:HAD-IB family hydrolase [uncultured Corynebacterium sp.]